MKKEEIIEQLIRMAEAEPWESTKTRDALYSAVEIVAKERARERAIDEYIAHDIWATNEAVKNYSAGIRKKELLVDAIGKPALLEQTAEECTELAQACLKYARYLRGENKVHKPLHTIKANFNEELADVAICIDELANGRLIDAHAVEECKQFKYKRMKERMAKDLQ